MNTAFVALLAIALGPKEWTADLNVTVRGIESGKAHVVQRLLANGSKQVETTIQLSSANGPGVRVRQESVYDALGRPVRRILETLNRTGAQPQRIVTTFDGGNASVTTDGKTKLVSLEKGLKFANPAELWFISSRPRPTDRTLSYTFDPGEGRWELLEMTYIGPASVTISGKRVVAHELAARKGGALATSLVDDNGMPIVLEFGDLRMERPETVREVKKQDAKTRG